MRFSKIHRRLPFLKKIYNRLDTARLERDAALHERDAASDERNAALWARDAAVNDRDAALRERNAAQSECSAALAQRSVALYERDLAIAERDSVFKVAKGVKLFVRPGHFYSPIVSTDDIRTLYDGRKDRDDLGIVLDLESQRGFFDEISVYLDDLPFPAHDDRKSRYYYENPHFSYSDAISLYLMIRHFKPARLIEVGSGFSSACALDTIDLFMNGATHCTFIEPYPQLLESLLKDADREKVTIIGDIVQNVDKDVFRELKENDILFIDSTHVVKTCSDVVFDILELLPILRKGVVVHLHDIFHPFEYPSNWVMEDNRSWNELYLLRAFLMYNETFEILFFNDYFAVKNAELLEQRCPLFLKNRGGSIWLKKVK